ncbi:MAG: SRPBCC family protein [Solirubrobacterales bacterium]|nr:SRPBCC family protein [Solirubrobacterales bacterium]
MRSAQAQITIDRSPEEIYEYLLDIASRPEFAPELFREFHLARVESKGIGAGARYRLHRKLRDRYAGTTITEGIPGQRLLEEGSTGRGGRVGMAAEFLLEEQPGGATKVTWILELYPMNPVDRMREIGQRRQINRRMKRGIRRLRGILEGVQSSVPGERPTVAGLDLTYVPNP